MPSFSLGERLDSIAQRARALTSSGHPGPSLYLIVRWYLYGYLLSLTYIILPDYVFHIKNNLRFC